MLIMNTVWALPHHPSLFQMPPAPPYLFFSGIALMKKRQKCQQKKSQFNLMKYFIIHTLFWWKMTQLGLNNNMLQLWLVRNRLPVKLVSELWQQHTTSDWQETTSDHLVALMWALLVCIFNMYKILHFYCSYIK